MPHLRHANALRGAAVKRECRGCTLPSCTVLGQGSGLMKCMSYVGAHAWGPLNPTRRYYR